MANSNEVRISLPVDVRCGTWLELELLGIKQIEAPEKDSLFVDVVLPPGWKKEADEHPMWSKLVDEQGRRRANIFHKCEFYCNEASIYLIPRFRQHMVFIEDLANSFYFTVIDELSGVVYRSETIAKPENCASESFDQYLRLLKKIEQSVTTWLDTNYPYWKSLLAYWGEISNEELASLAELQSSVESTEETIEFNIEDFIDLFDEEE